MGRSLKNIIAGLSEREQRLVAVMGLMFVAFIVFLFVFLVGSKISDLEDEADVLAEGLRLLDEKQAAYQERKLASTDTGNLAQQKPTPLPTLVDKACKAHELEMPDMKELPEQRHGASWVEHSVELSMRDVDLLNLTEFMEEIVKNRTRFPVAISKLEVNKRKKPDGATFHVKMTISTFEQDLTTPTKDAKRSASAARKKRAAAALKKGI